jgi:hypothetical protein
MPLPLAQIELGRPMSPPDEPLVIHLEQIEPGQHPPNLPEGQVHMYSVRHDSARRWIDLSLHQSDLEMVHGWLELLVHRHAQATEEANALWTAALITFFKCFQHSKRRTRLDAAIVLANEPDEGRAQFAVLQSLRDKAVVHDENAYTQGAVLIPIANPDGPVARVGKPHVLCFRASTLDDGHISNLRLLNLAAIAYVKAEIAQAAAAVEAYLRSSSRAELVATGPFTYTAPSPDTAHLSRSTG